MIHCQEVFEELLRRETARSLRSQRPFRLALVDISTGGPDEKLTMAWQIASVLSSSTREIDVKGWYAEGAVIGILFTEFGSMGDCVDAAEEAILGRLHGSLSGVLKDEDIRIAPCAPCQSGRGTRKASLRRH